MVCQASTLPWAHVVSIFSRVLFGFLPACNDDAVIECKELYNTQIFGQQDPYVQIKIGTVQKYRTKSQC